MESTVEGVCLFLERNSSLHLAFLLCVEGLSFFLLTRPVIALPLVSKEKEKLGPMLREKWKVWPWMASAWQKSMHLATKGELTSLTAVILDSLLKYQKAGACVEHAAASNRVTVTAICVF